MHPLYNALPVPQVQCGLHVMLWLHISILMYLSVLFPAEPCSSIRLLFLSQHLCRTLANPVFEDVGVVGCRANTYKLAQAAPSHIDF